MFPPIPLNMIYTKELPCCFTTTGTKRYFPAIMLIRCHPDTTLGFINPCFHPHRVSIAILLRVSGMFLFSAVRHKTPPLFYSFPPHENRNLSFCRKRANILYISCKPVRRNLHLSGPQCQLSTTH